MAFDAIPPAWDVLLNQIGPERLDQGGVTDHWFMNDIGQE
jgi:hypothetical protein